MRLNAKRTVRSFGGRKLIYNKIITTKFRGGGGPLPPLDPLLHTGHRISNFTGNTFWVPRPEF